MNRQNKKAMRKPNRQKVQCVVLGAAAAGKTSILRRFFNHKFEEHRSPTLGSNYYTGITHLPDKEGRGDELEIGLHCWDTPGKERFYEKQKKYSASLNDNFFKNGIDAIMLLYDMNSSTSFTQMLRWYADLLVLYKVENIPPILIVANKLDLYEADQERASASKPRKVLQRDVLGLSDEFMGKDFQYEYQVSPIDPTEQQKPPKNRRMEISSYLANRVNWTEDGSYLESLINSEDASSPDRDMVLLWCRKNQLEHMECSAATGQGVNEAMLELIRLALLRKQSSHLENEAYQVQVAKAATNPKLDLHQRYTKEKPCFRFCSFF